MTDTADTANTSTDNDYTDEQRQTVIDAIVQWKTDTEDLTDDERDEYANWLATLPDDELQLQAEFAVIDWVDWRDDLPTATKLASQHQDWPTRVDGLDPEDWPDTLYASVVHRHHIAPSE